MQQKQQQNLLERKVSLTNNSSSTSSNPSNKQQRSHSFWNHFGMGGTTNKIEDSSDNFKAANQVSNTPTPIVNEESGYSLNIQNKDVTSHGFGMAPR